MEFLNGTLPADIELKIANTYLGHLKWKAHCYMYADFDNEYGFDFHDTLRDHKWFELQMDWDQVIEKATRDKFDMKLQLGIDWDDFVTWDKTMLDWIFNAEESLLDPLEYDEHRANITKQFFNIENFRWHARTVSSRFRDGEHFMQYLVDHTEVGEVYNDSFFQNTIHEYITEMNETDYDDFF